MKLFSIENERLPEPFRKKPIILTLQDRITLLVGSFTLLPLRVVLLIPSVFIVWMTSNVGLIGMNEQMPAFGYRRKLQNFNKCLVRIIMRVCFGFTSPKITGELLPAFVAPVIAVAPHTSMFDFLVGCWLEPWHLCSGLVRDESRRCPILGTILRFHQMVFVSRGDSRSRGKAIRAITQRLDGAGWGRLIIFPEGTTTNGGFLLPFKKGAFLFGSRTHFVHPVIMTYPNRIDSTTWTLGNGSLLEIFLLIVRAMARLVNKVEIKVLPGVEVGPNDNPDELAERVRKDVGRKMGVYLYNEDISAAEEILHAQ